MSDLWVICRNSAVPGLSLVSFYCKKNKFLLPSDSFISGPELEKPGLYFNSAMPTFWSKVTMTNVVTHFMSKKTAELREDCLIPVSRGRETRSPSRVQVL